MDDGRRAAGCIDVAERMESGFAGMGEADAMFLVCGHSGSGKWVFCRCLVNRLLNFENCAVGFMDLDPGQTEIAPPVGLKLDRGLNV